MLDLALYCAILTPKVSFCLLAGMIQSLLPVTLWRAYLAFHRYNLCTIRYLNMKESWRGLQIFLMQLVKSLCR